MLEGAPLTLSALKNRIRASGAFASGIPVSSRDSEHMGLWFYGAVVSLLKEQAPEPADESMVSPNSPNCLPVNMESPPVH